SSPPAESFSFLPVFSLWFSLQSYPEYSFSALLDKLLQFLQCPAVVNYLFCHTHALFHGLCLSGDIDRGTCIQTHRAAFSPALLSSENRLCDLRVFLRRSSHQFFLGAACVAELFRCDLIGLEPSVPDLTYRGGGAHRDFIQLILSVDHHAPYD